jgi:FixJ family two-component response regulator
MDPGRKVLVVDDDVGMREAIESLLEIAGFETATYASAEALLAGDAVDAAVCIVSDFKLPVMSGLDLLTELRARGGQPPVIVITAHDAPGLREIAERKGAAAYLCKPFAGSALLAAIESVARSPGRT